MRSVLLIILMAFMAQYSSGEPGAGAIVMTVNPDARTDGMGGAGAAVWWSAPDPWHNPALLGYYDRATFLRSHFQLTPDLANVFFESSRLVLGYAGFGLLLQNGPFTSRIDGEQIATDEQGNVIGVFNFFEQWQGYGFGFSSGAFLEKLSTTLLDAPVLALIARHVDVSVGLVVKDYEDRLVPDEVIPDGSGSASATMTDYGVLGRVSLYNSLKGPGYLPKLDAELYPILSGWRLSVAYGRSWLNWGDDWLVYSEAIQYPLPREYRRALSLRAEFGLPGKIDDGLSPLLSDALSPMLAYSRTWDKRWPGYVRRDDKYVYEENTDPRYRLTMSGWELTFLNMFCVRRGQVEAPYIGYDYTTSGWGLQFNIAGIHARYDRATLQFQGLEGPTRKSWLIGMDLFTFLSAVKSM